MLSTLRLDNLAIFCQYYVCTPHAIYPSTSNRQIEWDSIYLMSFVCKTLWMHHLSQPFLGAIFLFPAFIVTNPESGMLARDRSNSCSPHNCKQDSNDKKKTYTFPFDQFRSSEIIPNTEASPWAWKNWKEHGKESLSSTDAGHCKRSNCGRWMSLVIASVFCHVYFFQNCFPISPRRCSRTDPPWHDLGTRCRPT